MLIFGVGAAPLQLAERPLLSERVGVAVLLGLSISSVVGALITLTPLWYPFEAAALVALPSAAAHVIGVSRSMRALRDAQLNIFTQLRVSEGRSGPTAVSIGLAICGAALSIAAASGLGHIEPGLGGFLPVISPAWYLGLLMMLAAIVFARQAGESAIALAVLLLGGVLTLTPAIVYGEPSSQSAFKHVLLVEQVLQTHHLHASSYIYYAYSGLFDGMAWLYRIVGVANPLGLATYWPALVGLLGALELRFLLGRVIRSGHRCWIGVLLATLANSVGQNYFSPQSEGFVIAVGVFGLVIIGHEQLAMPRSTQFAALVVSGFALAVTHELSPYLTGGAVLGVDGLSPRQSALGRRCNPRPRGRLGAAEPARPVRLRLIQQSRQPFELQAAGIDPDPGLVRSPAVGYGVDALVFGMLVLMALALIGLIRNRRRAGAWAFTVASGVGIVFIAVNPYGSEGIFRAALFGIPWLLMIGLAAIRRPSWRWPSFAVVAVVMLACYLTSSFSLDATNVVHRGDLNVLNAYITQAPPGAYYLEVGGDGDLPSTLDPQQHNIRWDPLWNPDNPHQASVFSTGHPHVADLNALTNSYITYARSITRTPARNLFAVYSPVGARYSVEYALETMKNSRDWLQLLLHSPRWTLLTSSDGSYLFRYRAGAPRTHGATAGASGLGGA